MFAVYSILLFCVFFSTASAETIVFRHDKADSVFARFITVYAEMNKKSLTHQIPLNGRMLSIFKTLLIVHSTKSVDPNSIDRLIKHYNLQSHSLQCKKLYVSMIGELRSFDRIICDSVIVETDSNGTIYRFAMKPYGNRKGKMQLGKAYFQNVNIRISTLLYNQSGGKR